MMPRHGECIRARSGESSSFDAHQGVLGVNANKCFQRVPAVMGSMLVASGMGGLMCAFGQTISSTTLGVAAAIVLGLCMGGWLGGFNGVLVGGLYGALAAAFGSVIGGTTLGVVLTI